MGTKIYVGNLPFSVRDKELQDLFAPFGKVSEATVITDRGTGRSKGFGFVTFEEEESVKKAIEELNDKEHDGRKLKVNEARPMKE